jgi:SAM-dependent methyltransferase
MTKPSADSPPWALVDEGWGRKVVDFATLSEPANCREYVAMHHRLGVDAGDGCSTWLAGPGSPSSWPACAVAEIYRVLRPGRRAGITVWGHLKVSPGAWALAPFRLAAAEKVGNRL